MMGKELEVVGQHPGAVYRRFEGELIENEGIASSFEILLSLPLVARP